MRSLAKEQPILGSRCPRAQARIFIYSVELRDGRIPTIDGLGHAAQVVTACIHQVLLESASPLELGTAQELWNAKRWAMRALVETSRGSKIRAKEVEMRLTGERPLTICMGSPKPVVVDTELGSLDVPMLGLGCRCVYPDSTRITGGRMWRFWCKTCDKNRPQLWRAARKEHGKRVRAYVAVGAGQPKRSTAGGGHRARFG